MSKETEGLSRAELKKKIEGMTPDEFIEEDRKDVEELIAWLDEEKPGTDARRELMKEWFRLVRSFVVVNEGRKKLVGNDPRLDDMLRMLMLALTGLTTGMSEELLASKPAAQA